MNLAFFKGAEAKPIPDNLEQLLEMMCGYGTPRLSKHDSGWYCNCEMRVSAIGASFKVESTFKEPTPTAAVKTCMLRIIETLKGLK